MHCWFRNLDGVRIIETFPRIVGRDIWVFGYGSLMWRPGFSHVEAHTARLFGYHRALCIRSMIHRGTPENPGLVMGLKVGGSCVGRAYRVAAADAEDVLDYLTWRELRRDTYRATACRLWLADRAVDGICFTVHRGSTQYSGDLTLAEMARFIDEGIGSSGSSYDYLLDAVTHLEAFGMADPKLKKLLQTVNAKRKGSPSGA